MTDKTLLNIQTDNPAVAFSDTDVVGPFRQAGASIPTQDSAGPMSLFRDYMRGKAPSVLIQQSFDGKVSANSAIYTVPAGKTLVVTQAEIVCTAASGITAPGSAGFGRTAGTSDIFASTTLTGLTAANSTYGYSSIGASFQVTAGNSVFLNYATSTGTSQTLRADLVGYLT